MDVEDADAFILLLKVIEIIFFQFRGKLFKFSSLHSLSVIRNGDEEILFSGLYAEKDASAGRDSIEPVFDAVLYKRLENQLYNVAVQAAFIDIGMEGKFAAETDALNIDVVVHVVDFLCEGDNAGGIMVDAVAQQGGEPGIYLTGCIIFFHFNERVDDFQRVKKEVGVDLGLESHEFGVLFLHFHDVVFFDKLADLSHHLGEGGVKNADLITAQPGGFYFQVAPADFFYFVQNDDKPFIYTYGQNKTGGYGDKQKDQDTGGEGAVQVIYAFQGAGVGKIVNGPEAGGGIGARQVDPFFSGIVLHGIAIVDDIVFVPDKMEVFIHFGEGLSVDVVAPVINNKKLVGIISVHTFHGLEHLFRKQAEFDHAGYPGTVGGVYRLQNGKKLCVIGAFRMHKVVVKITVFKLFFPGPVFFIQRPYKNTSVFRAAGERIEGEIIKAIRELIIQNLADFRIYGRIIVLIRIRQGKNLFYFIIAVHAV